MGRPRKAPPEEPLPNRLAGEFAHQEPDMPSGESESLARIKAEGDVTLHACDTCGKPVGDEDHKCEEDDIILHMNARSRAQQATEAPILEGATTADHPNYLPGMAPVYHPELDILAAARHQAMQARKAAGQVEDQANKDLIAKMHALKRTAYTTAEGLIVVVSATEKVTTKHDSGKKTKHGINNHPDDPALDALDDAMDEDDNEQAA